MNKEELEKEADDYAEIHAFRVPYDGSNKFYDDVDFKASKEGYLAAAEPREKRIAELEEELKAIDKAGEHVRQQINDAFRNKKPYWELEKENAELKKKLKEELKTIADKDLSFVARFDALEKENAELKETVLQFQKDSYCGVCHFKTKTQLTKAKEIIKELVRVEYADFTNGDYSNELSKVLEQAEQFLSEVEK